MCEKLPLCFCNISNEFKIAQVQRQPLRAFLRIDYPIGPFGERRRPSHAVADLIVKVLEHDAYLYFPIAATTFAQWS
jgi:hypothetical protein